LDAFKTIFLGASQIYEGIGVELTQIMTDLAVKTSRRH